MKHLDLFSGIGGFSLASDTIFHEQENQHIFVEHDAFCTAVLKKHWPNAEYHGDIRTFVATAEQGERPFILTGGFPCQPFSHAGRRKGTDDDRYLWPPMLEAIKVFRPRWVIAENVAGLGSWNDGLVLETVCADLEREGYEVQPFIIPACAVGAPHRRDRIWFVARNTEYDGQHGSEDGKGGTEGSDSDTSGQNENEQSAGSVVSRDIPQESPWKEDWHEAATRLCTLDDGLPSGLVRPKGWRNAALKAAGNAIVPQVAMEIMRAIKEYETNPS